MYRHVQRKMFEFFNKKNLVGILGVIVVLTLITIYYGSTSKHSSISQNMDGYTYFFDNKALLNDNKNDVNVTKCWEKEEFKILEGCERCDKFLRKTLTACMITGYREIIKCDDYGIVSRICPVPLEVKQRHFWNFAFVTFCCLVGSTYIVLKRKSYLDKITAERVRQHLIET